MAQLTEIDRRVAPQQVYLVVDAMTGQDAVHSAKAFNEALELDGVIMTKLDGDARGGAALSVKAVTGVPIKLVGTGEHLDALEEFHPDRMAGRILGMGDVLTLVEQAQQKFDQEEMAKQEARLRKGEFTLDDFKKMLGQTKKLGPINKIMSMMPGMGGMADMLGEVDTEQDVRRFVGIIDSMTPDERRNPSRLIDHSRRRRIAAGAGVEPHEVNELVKSVRRHGRHDEADGGHGHARPHEDHAAAIQKRHDEPRRHALQAESRHRQAADPAREGQAAETAGERITATKTRGKE